MATYLSNWQERASELTDDFAQRLCSVAEFQDRLTKLVKAAGSPFAFVTVEVNQGADRKIVYIGNAPAGEESTRYTLKLGETTSAILRAWLHSNVASTPDEDLGVIRRLVESWWRVADRDGMTGLWQSSRAGVLSALASTIDAWSPRGLCTVAFCDIDRFKQLNDKLGQVVGDEAISFVAGQIADLAPSDGIVLRRGGDEFLIALPTRSIGQSVEELLALQFEVERLILQKYPSVGDLPLGFSMGVAMLQGSDVQADGWDERAERAMKPEGQKQRGRVSFEAASEFVPAEFDGARASVETVRAKLGQERPFANIWLAWLSDLGALAADGSWPTAESIAQAISRVGPKWSSGAFGRILWGDNANPDGSRDLSALDIALALAHGISRLGSSQLAQASLVVSYGIDGTYACLKRGEEVLFVEGSPDSEVVSARFPVFVGEVKNTDSRRLIALQIGERAEFLYPGLYAEHIYLDDRPTLGGGLPDFWEAALAQVIDSLRKHPNVTGIVIKGNPDHGRRTVQWLRADWTDFEISYLSSKLNVSPSGLSILRRQLTPPVILTSDDPAGELSIATAAHDVDTPLKESPVATVPTAVPRLHRELVTRPFLLDKQDGCRVLTASIAYPLALDIVRQADTDLFDVWRRSFSELVDFRIQLVQPTEDPIPRYYLGDEESLTEYFDREFESPGGKFYDALQKDNQYEHVLSHLCNCIDADAFASRRAVMVLPHEPESPDVSPLGLISVRSIPRLQANGTVRLDFSFTWRTVEAVVGLPYSLFGSIRFSERITERVANRPDDNGKRTVLMGQVSYIAHSLHMYNDGYGASVARRIVNDESL